jgi:DNA-binding NtrC family response regulator
MKNRKAIVCVDDEAIILLSIKQELISYFGNSFQYETALSATEAMGIIDEITSRGVKVIVIISDWLMPGIKGDEFLLEINKKYPDIKGIIISGQADEDAILNLEKKINLQAFIRKPWKAMDLILEIKKCLEKDDAQGGSSL